MDSAARAALGFGGNGEDGLPAGEHVVAFELAYELVHTHAVYGAAEALAGLAQLAVEEDGLLDELHDLVLGVDSADVGAEPLCLAPDAADDHGVTALFFGEAVHRAGSDALAAVRALFRIDDYLAGCAP